jgi:hypothetical protein
MSDAVISDAAIPVEKELTVVLSRAPLAKDRRRNRRYRCGPATLVVVHETATNLKTDGWAWDLSESGIGLTLPYPLDPGSTVQLRLRGRPPFGTIVVPALVAHATPQCDGTWRIGCAFKQKLEPERLEALL